MSAYGAIAAPVPLAPLVPLSWPLPGQRSLATYPVNVEGAPRELREYLYEVFAAELEEGKTYPQEGEYTLESFETYFFLSASITVIGILFDGEVSAIPSSLEEARGGRSWRDCVGGCYYIKPNYPGRSSHNAGFLVPPPQRAKKIGGALAQSYVEYAPKLGYRGSVFNLVYKNNAASLRLWDKLGFTRVGVIPNAGRLKTGPNGEEEYVDAIIVYKSWV